MFNPASTHLEAGPMITPFHREGFHRAMPPASPVSFAGNASRIYYCPIVLPSATPVERLFWANGGTVGTDSVRIGIYSDRDAKPYARLVNGNLTLSAGANALQFDDVGDVVLPAGRYWLAFVQSGVTANFQRVNSSSFSGRYLDAASTTTLPPTASPTADANTASWVPVFGICTVAAP